MAAWCSKNNLSLNTKKTKEINVDFRRHRTDLTPVHINGECMEKVHTFWFLCVLISWTDNITAIIKKAQPWLRVLRKHNLVSNLVPLIY